MQHCQRFMLVFLPVILILLTSLPVFPAERTAGDLPKIEGASTASGDIWNFEARGRWAYGPCQAISVVSGFATVANGATLQFWDLRSPLFPVLYGEVALPANIEAIDFDGNWAYVANHSGGLQIVDTGDPNNLEIYSSLQFSSWALDVEYNSGYLYVAADVVGLRIIDVSNPKFPAEVGFYDTAERALGVAFAYNHVFVADDAGGLRIIDVSNPTAPTEVGHYDTPGSAKDVFVLNEIAYVADYHEGLIALDVSTKSNPLLYGSFHAGGRSAWDVQVAGQVAYVSNHGGGLDVVDVSNSGTFPLIDNYSLGVFMYDIEIEGTQVFAACDHEGAKVIDVSGSPPSLAGTTGAWDSTAGVDYYNNHVFIANMGHGLVVVDVSNPDNPTQVGMYDTPGEAQDVWVNGSLGYVCDGYGGLLLLDVFTPSTPGFVGSYDSPGFASSVYVSGSYAYLADGPDGLRIIDVGVPPSPWEDGSFDTAGQAEDVIVKGDYAYVADGAEGIRVIQINPPDAATEVGFYDPASGWAYAVDITGDYLYVANGIGGLLVLDISTPRTPTLVKALVGGWSGAVDIKIDGDYVYVGDRQQGIKVYYIVDPTNPLFVGEFDNYDWSEGMAVYGNRVFLAEELTGVSILDFISPPTPTLVQAFDARAIGSLVELQWEVVSDDVMEGYRIYRSTRESEAGLINADALIPPDVDVYSDGNVEPGNKYAYTLAVVLDDGTEIRSQQVEVVVDVAALSLDQNYPNPFNPVTTISFTLPSPQHVTLSVFNAEGKLIRALIDETLEGGFKQQSWDGRDASGTPVSSGVYFYQLTSGKRTLTRKMVLLK